MKDRRIKIASLLLALLLIVTTVGLAGCGSDEDEENTVKEVIVAVGSGSATSAEYGKAVVSWLKECYANDDTLAFKTRANANDITNMRKLISGDASFAVMPGDIAYFAKTGTEYFDAPMEDITIVAELCSIGSQLIAGADTGINTVQDLRGKKVAAGDEGSSTRLLFEKIAEACGISGEVEYADMKYSESVEALEAGEIDAIFAQGDAPFKKVLELAVTKGVKLIDIGEDVCNKLAEENEYLEPVKIPEQTYKGQQDAVNTIGIKLYLMKNDTLVSDEFWEEILDNIKAGKDQITEDCEKAEGFKALS